MLPLTTGPLLAADEDILIEKIAQLARQAGWTVTSGSTDPAGSYWFESSGSDGLHSIVGGFNPDASSRIITGYTAVDLDTFGIESANISGYTNNDSVSATTRVQADTNTSQYVARDNLTEYRYMAAINKDAISVSLTFTSNSAKAQGLLYLGNTDPVAGRQLQKQARAKIESVTTGTSGSQRTITLDRDITAALKDKSDLPGDPHTQYLQFQSVISGSGESGDFCQVERIAIIDNTLSSSAGKTKFEIDGQSGVKLARVGGRYDNFRGVNDIVSLTTEPNIVCCVADRTANAFGPFWFNQGIITAWDAYCGQADNLDVRLLNEHSNQEDNHDPEPLSNRTPYYKVYVVTVDTNTGLVSQPNEEGKKNIGSLKNLIIAPFQGQPDLSFFKIDNDSAQRYRCQEFLTGVSAGLRVPADFTGGNMVFLIGPGW